MSDIVLSSKRKVNIFDRMIQSIVIAVNMVKMNRAIDEHLQNVSKCDKEEERQYQENILREIVFVKYQYDIMQREMYELKISYPDEVIDNPGFVLMLSGSWFSGDLKGELKITQDGEFSQ